MERINGHLLYREYPEYVVFRESFTGDGSATTFTLGGTVGNATFHNTSWSLSCVATTFPAHVTNTNKKPTYDSLIPLTRNRVGVSSINGTTGVVTLDYAPRNGVNFYIWYWYALPTHGLLEDYYREDFVASMEEEAASYSEDITVTTTNFGGILSSADNTVQKALDTIDDHNHDSRYYTETEADALLAGKSDTGHNHTESDITDLDKYTQAEVDSAIDTDIATHAASGDHDGRYYTETELDNGQLDGRYYTENEVNTLLGSYELDSHLHDGEILQLDAINSDGGAFSFATTGDITFNHGLILPDGGALKVSDGNPQIILDNANGYVEITGKVGIGANAPAGPLHVQDTTLNTTDSFYGIYGEFTKTAGVTTTADVMYGMDSTMIMNDADSTIGHLMGGYYAAQLDAGAVGDGGLSRTVRALYGRADINGGTVTGDVYGFYTLVDIEAAATVTNSVFGHYLAVDADADPGNTVYMIYLSEGTNIDYCIYQDGSSENRFGGVVNAVGGFQDNGVAGIDATFTNGDGDTVTVSGGIITDIS